jgi:hypothetical protein
VAVLFVAVEDTPSVALCVLGGHLDVRVCCALGALWMLKAGVLLVFCSLLGLERVP